MLIAYCDKCGLRLPHDAIETGDATPIDEGRYLCAKCAGAAPAAAPRKKTTGIVPRGSPARGTSHAATADVRAAMHDRPSTGSAARMPIPAAAHAPAARGESSKAAAQSAGERAPVPMLPIVLGAAGAVVFLIGVFFAMSGSGKTPDRPVASKPQPDVPATTAPPAPSSTGVAAKTPPTDRGPQPVQPASEQRATATLNVAERARQAEKEMEALRNERAARMLKDAQDWFARNPHDPWTYKEKLSAVVNSYRSAPAGAEAAKLLAEVKLPEGEMPSDSLMWPRNWTLTPGEQTQMHAEYDGRKFVYQTHPVAAGRPHVMSKKAQITAEQRILNITLRGHDNGNFRLIVDVGDRRLLEERVEGRDWKTYACDLTPLQGQTVEISLQQHNTWWENEHGYWQCPQFADQPAGGAKIVSWDAGVPLTLPQDDAAWKDAVDLLALVDLGRDKIHGTWNMRPGEGLLSGWDHHARVQFPHRPPEEYDLKMVFTRRNGNEAFAEVLAKGGKSFAFTFAGWDNKYVGFEQIRNERADRNVTSIERPGGALENGRRYTSVMQIRNDGMRAYLDGKLLSSWRTDYSDMSQYKEWNLRDQSLLGVATYAAEYCFHSVQILEVSGKGTTVAAATVGQASSGTAATPPAATARNWKALFDGRTLDCIVPLSREAWQIENGALTNIVSKRNSAQTSFEFGDGDMRVRFEPAAAIVYMQFTARQSEQGGFAAEFDKVTLPQMAGKTHEIVFSCRGETVTATLDGQPLPLKATGASRRGRLQMYARDGVLKILSLEFAEPGSGTAGQASSGTPAGQAAVGAPKSSTAGQASSGTTPGTVAGGAPVEAKLEYERMLADVYTLLAKGGAARAAIDRLQKAKGEAKLAALAGALEQDIQCTKHVDDAENAIKKGVEALAGKRPLVLRRNDGKELAVGKGSKNTIAGLKDGTLTIEQDLGGGTALAKWSLEQLTPATRYDLARLGLAGAPDADLKLACAGVVLLSTGAAQAAQATPKSIRTQLEAATKAGAPAERVQHILGRVAAFEREAAVDGVLKKLSALMKDKKWQDAKATIEELRREYGATLALAKVQADFEKQVAEVEFQLNPMRPGLWASFWSGDWNDKFKTMHFARVETTLRHDWGDGSPDARVPNDQFACKFGGKLRIERDGKYFFRGNADDELEVWLDGNKLLDKGQEKDISLTRGDHDIKIIQKEHGGGANMWMEWKLDGSFDWQDIPASALFHDAKQTEKYEKQ
jgi:hypothetical protein